MTDGEPTKDRDIQIPDSQLTPEQFAYRLLADIGEKSGPGEASYR
jgi:hypothetical protein